MQYRKHLITALLSTILLLTVTSGITQPKPVLTIQPDWTRDYAPFRLAGNLYYVGSYELASYLITTPQGHILINTGVQGSDTMIRRHVEALGFRFSDIRILLLNQAHFDHTGALAAIKKSTHALLMADSADAGVLADGGNSDFLFGGHGRGALFEPVKPDLLLHDKDTIRLGEMQILLLHHPGHTKGSCSFLFTVKDETRSYRVLIANIPTILEETKLPTMPTYPEVGRDYAYTHDTMPRLSFDIWTAAHASQFFLHKKHQPGDAYNPSAFADRPGYDSVIRNARLDYEEKRKTARP